MSKTAAEKVKNLLLNIENWVKASVEKKSLYIVSEQIRCDGHLDIKIMSTIIKNSIFIGLFQILCNMLPHES